MKTLFLLLIVSGYYNALIGQQLSYSDPAQAYNRLLLEKGNNSFYRRIENYKVIGSPYLYGDMYNGIVYSDQNGSNTVAFKFNVFDQTLEIQTEKEGQFIIKSIAEVDSFYFIGTKDNPIVENIHFVNARLLDSTKLFFVQSVNGNLRYRLFKAYSMSLGNVSNTYLNSDLRQFDLNVNYYYLAPGERYLKKLKLTKASLKDNFSNIDVDIILKRYKLSLQAPEILKEIFFELNNK